MCVVTIGSNESTQTHGVKTGSVVVYSTGPTTHLYPTAGWTESQCCEEEKEKVGGQKPKQTKMEEEVKR